MQLFIAEYLNGMAYFNKCVAFIGTIAALYTLLGAFGALGCTVLGDILGRRKTIFFSNAVQVIGAILEATAFELGQFIVARIVLGLGLGTGGIIATISV